MSDPLDLLPQWPDLLLDFEPLNDSYVVTPPDPLIRSDFEQGLARQRRAFRQAPGTYGVVWPMTPLQKYIFDGWVEYGLGGGEKWFAIPVFTRLDYDRLQVRIVKGSTKVTRSGGEWLIALTLETPDTKLPSDADIGAIFLTYGTTETLADIVASIHHIVHVDYPAALP